MVQAIIASKFALFLTSRQLRKKFWSISPLMSISSIKTVDDS